MEPAETLIDVNLFNTKCLLLNARSVCNKFDEFNVLLKTVKPQIVAITESWLNDNFCDNFLDPDNQYNLFKHSRALSRGGGVCLLIDKQIKCTPVSYTLDLPGVELVCVDLATHGETTRLAVCYRSTSLAHASIEMNSRLVNCLDKLFRVKHKCILMGDFNLPKIDWNSDHLVISDPIHELFYVHFCSVGLSQLNTIPTRNDAILDLIFSNDPGIVSDISTLPPLGASDHDVITFSISLQSRDPNDSAQARPVTARNYIKCNYELLNAELCSLDWNVIFAPCVAADDYWQTFTKLLNNLLDVYCPLIVTRANRINKTFHYPPRIKRLQAHKKRVWRRLRSNKYDETIRAEYKTVSDAYSEAINEFHQERESEVLNSNDSSRFHKFIRRKLNRKEGMPTLLDDDGSSIDDCDVKANLFNNLFSSAFTHDDGNLPPFPSRIDPSTDPLENVLFSPSSVLTKLLRIKKSTTLNPDNFPPIVLRSCAHQLSVPLAIIFNIVFNLSDLPSSWSTSTVIPLFKKGQRNHAANYRPISITSSCCKIMESIIHDQMSVFLLSNNLISEHQHGFLKNRSTISNLLDSTRKWLASLNAGRSTDIVYIDFAKAFDSVSHPKLLLKLKAYGIDGKLLAWISAWLSGRTQSVRLGDFFSLPLPVLSGILQGSVLGPLLFLLFINDLIDIIPPEANPTLFADDLKLFSDMVSDPVGSSLSSVSSPLIQTALDLLHLWSQLWQLPISIPKCSVLSISNSKKPLPRSYTIDVHILPQVTSCPDLGVVVDDKLSFSCHILSATKKAYRKSALISRCFHSKNATNLKRAFCSYVRPILEYASQVWSPHTLKNISLLENVQRRFTKTISRLHFSPYPLRLSSLSIPSLAHRRIHIDLCTVYRILHHHIFLDSSVFFSLRTSSITRGHPFTLCKQLVRLDTSKFAFCARVIDVWNALPIAVVSAGSITAFKAMIKTVPLP